MMSEQRENKSEGGKTRLRGMLPARKGESKDPKWLFRGCSLRLHMPHHTDSVSVDRQWEREREKEEGDAPFNIPRDLECFVREEFTVILSSTAPDIHFHLQGN